MRNGHNTPGNFLQESLLNREGYREVRIWVGMATGTITMGTRERGAGQAGGSQAGKEERQMFTERRNEKSTPGETNHRKPHPLYTGKTTLHEENR